MGSLKTSIAFEAPSAPTDTASSRTCSLTALAGGNGPGRTSRQTTNPTTMATTAAAAAPTSSQVVPLRGGGCTGACPQTGCIPAVCAAPHPAMGWLGAGCEPQTGPDIGALDG